MQYEIRDYNPSDPMDAERLAALFNAMESAWPGGFMRGIPCTAEAIQRRMSSADRMAVLVATCGTDFVGYCDVRLEALRPDWAYIDLLGARLEHHGKGVGKKLLLEVIRRVTESGLRELTLHTWPGNLKAVPLYKKTGFFWMPETSVYMRNFIPAILNLPHAREFFGDQDWYLCQQRDLALCEDDVRWKGMRVFPYVFRDGDRFLHCIFDAASGGMTGLETPDFSLSCSIPVEEAVIGGSCPIVWEFTAHHGAPREVLLFTETGPECELTVQEHGIVDGTHAWTHTLRISSHATPTGQEMPAPRVRTHFIVDGQPILLETGVRLKRPLAIEVPVRPLRSGFTERVEVNLANHLDEPLAGELVFESGPEIECADPIRAFSLPARFLEKCVFTVKSHTPGAHRCALHFRADLYRGTAQLVLPVLQGTETVATIDPDWAESAALVSADLCMECALTGGDLTVKRRPFTEEPLITMDWPSAGPPYISWRTHPLHIEASRVQMQFGDILVASVMLPEREGLRVERRVSFLGGDLICTQMRAINLTGEPMTTHLRVNLHPELKGFLVLPTVEGLLREPLRSRGDFPSDDLDALPPGGRLAEEWYAIEEDGQVCGVFWLEPLDHRTTWGSGLQLISKPLEIPAFGSHQGLTLYVMIGQGGWQNVRTAWRTAPGCPAADQGQQALEPSEVLAVRSEPSPLLLSGGHGEATLSLLNRRGRALTGKLRLDADRFQITPSECAVAEVDRSRPAVFHVAVTGPELPIAELARAEAQDETSVYNFQLPIIEMGGGTTLRVQEIETGHFTVENGLLTLRADANFLGSLYGLEREGVSYLGTAYPQTVPFEWINPWHGGIHLYLHRPGESQMSRESFTGTAVSRKGASGFEWSGVAMTCAWQHRDLRWLTMEAQYLTRPGSNLVALVNRWTNHNPVPVVRPWNCGVAVWPKIGGSWDTTVLRWQDETGSMRLLHRGDTMRMGRAGAWVAVEEVTTGDSVLLIPAAAGDSAVFRDWGRSGVHLYTKGRLCLPANDTLERIAWLVIRPEPGDREAYTHLARLRTLP